MKSDLQMEKELYKLNLIHIKEKIIYRVLKLFELKENEYVINKCKPIYAKQIIETIEEAFK